MATLPASFANQLTKHGNKVTIRSIKDWTMEQIGEYNAVQTASKFEIVKYKCGQVGQRTSAKRHATKCNECGTCDTITVNVFDTANTEWSTNIETLSTFTQGKGTKRNKKKQPAKGQKSIMNFFRNTNNENRPNAEEVPAVESEEVKAEEHETDDERNEEDEHKWIVLERTACEVTDDPHTVANDEEKDNKYVTKPSHLLIRYSHDGLCLFDDDLDDQAAGSLDDEMYTVYCENCSKWIGNKAGYNWNNTKQRQAMIALCVYHFEHHGPKEPAAWRPLLKRCTAIMTLMFYTLIRMIEDNKGDANWPQYLADQHLLNNDIGNRLHSHHILPQFKQYIYEESIQLISNSITKPLDATGVGAGCSISADSGSKWMHSYDFHRIKSFNTETMLPVSAMSYAQPLNDTDLASTKSAAGAIKSKQKLFDALDLDIVDVQKHVHGFHADGQMHEVGWNVAAKMKEEYNFTDWYNDKSDVCHEIERVNDGV